MPRDEQRLDFCPMTQIMRWSPPLMMWSIFWSAIGKRGALSPWIWIVS